MLEFSLNLPTTSSKDIIFSPSGDVQAFVTDSLRLRTETDVLSDILAENPQEVTEAKEEHGCLDNNHQGNNLGMMTGWSSQFEQQGKWTKCDAGLLYCCIVISGCDRNLKTCNRPNSTSIVKAKKKKSLFCCNGVEKNRVGRSVKNIFLNYFFGQKCVFYACFTLIGSWEGRKNFRVGILFNKNLLG